MCDISEIYNFFDKTINSRNIIKKIISLQYRIGVNGYNLWNSDCNKVIIVFIIIYKYYLFKLSKNREFNNLLRNWTTFSLKKYLEYV